MEGRALSRLDSGECHGDTRQERFAAGLSASETPFVGYFKTRPISDIEGEMVRRRNTELRPG